MPIAINGNGTITGVSVGGLPDGIVDTDMLATDAVTAPKIGTNTFVSYAVIVDQKTSGTHGGTFTSGAWRTRDLNTEVTDEDGIVSISSNQFTLGAGTYLIEWAAPAVAVNQNQSRLQDITGAATVTNGMNNRSNSASLHSTISTGAARVRITADNTYEIQHRSLTTGSTSGFGQAISLDAEIYTIVKIYKEA